jgi:hypothetical protein
MHCELHGLGIESWWGQGFPNLSRWPVAPTQPPVQWIPELFPRVKWLGHGGDHPSPTSTQVKSGVIPLLPLWACVFCFRVDFTFTASTFPWGTKKSHRNTGYKCHLRTETSNLDVGNQKVECYPLDINTFFSIHKKIKCTLRTKTASNHCYISFHLTLMPGFSTKCNLCVYCHYTFILLHVLTHTVTFTQSVISQCGYEQNIYHVNH